MTVNRFAALTDGALVTRYQLAYYDFTWSESTIRRDQAKRDLHEMRDELLKRGIKECGPRRV